ncbi:YGGT family protein [Modestobacter sp. DSM 44400]|uniref:YggT family protein n=1 Tax=Modestobacter sp. DSM 44400 TaxID=1550230 RepID=UPI00089D9BB7|nr:YggT family protein [Modestobacter sp. DSM 44400]SDX59849.1 YGGT family protein [Modestobacter sp. DSM 44400]
MAGFGAEVLIEVGQLVLGFYGFWLVWRVLLPVLPGAGEDRRLSPFAMPLTDPFVGPLTRLLRLPPWVAALLLLVVDAAASVALGRIG